WIVFTDRAILQTPEFTRSIMMHELRHAADQWTLFQAFQRDHGPPPPRPADPAQCRPFTTGQVVIGTDPWDQYVGEFIRYHDNRVAPGRHLEITAMEQQEDFARWSAREQADWVESMFANLPGDIPPDVSLPGEQAVLSTFAGASTALRRVIVHAAANVFRMALHPPVQWDVPENAAEQRENRARARTLLGHFAPIVDAAI